MPSKAMILSSDSPNPPAPDIPLYAVVENGEFYLLDVRPSRLYSLSTLGHEACSWIEQQEQPPAPVDDEYAFMCVFCEKLIADCKCGMR